MQDSPPPTSLTYVLIAGITVLAGVIAYLFRYYMTRLAEHEKDRRDRDAQQAAERMSWAVERAELESTLKAEYETKHRQIVEAHTQSLRDLYEAARREYAANMEVVQAQASLAAEKIAIVLDKIYERSIGTSRRTAKTPKG